MGEFKVKNSGQNLEELELELIDFGLEEIGENSEGQIIIRTAYTEFGNMSKALEEKGIEVRGFPADWDKYQKRAGFIRNSQMLNEGKPHAVAAFPGGVGTRMMVGLARRAGVPVREFYPKWLTSDKN